MFPLTNVASSECWRHFPRLLSHSPVLRYSRFISVYFFFMLRYIFPCPVSPSMLTSLFDFSCLFLNIICASSSPHTLLYDFFLLYLWALPPSLGPWQGLWKKRGRKSTLHYELLACVMCFLDHELRFCRPSGGQQTNESLPGNCPVFSSSSHFSLLFLSRPLIWSPLCYSLSISPSLSAPSMSASAFSPSCIME